MPRETVLTAGPGGRILTNCHVWSPDGRWVVFDTRSDPAGAVFDGTRIQAVNVETREVRTLYESRNGACCGVATWHPQEMTVAFILGPEHPTPGWDYGVSRRQGVIVAFDRPGVAVNLDARNLTPPYTPGALRGGSHVHVWHPAGDRVSFTYDDEVVRSATERNVGVAVPRRVDVPDTHPRNHPGEYFSALVTRTVTEPTPGTDEISRASEEGWVGTDGYVRLDGTRQRRAVAFQGTVNVGGRAVPEVFVADLPDDLTRPGDEPLEGTAARRPAPPRGVTQRRLTYGGVHGPRHWLRSSPDGSRIGFLRHDPTGVVQFWTVSPNGGEPVQVTANPHPVQSAFTWQPDGRRVAFVMDGSVCLTDVTTGSTARLTARTDDATAPRPEACVVSPDGTRVAFVRRLPGGEKSYNQICVVDLP
jgi:Tol biopolymer transport system component